MYSEDPWLVSFLLTWEHVDEISSYLSYSFLFNTVLLLYHVNAQVNIPSSCLPLAEPEAPLLIGQHLRDVTGESYLWPVCAVLCVMAAAAGWAEPDSFTGPNPHLDNFRTLIVWLEYKMCIRRFKHEYFVSE